MNKLSNDITAIKAEYEVIVIGSGYGGSIAASRMARAGKKVCLLEKGKEFLPGTFPTGLIEATKEMQLSKGSTHIGSENGLYEFVVGDDITVFKGCGLGGTSLVNANVSIEPEARVFEGESWPKAIREDMDSVREGYKHAREMLRPTPYPEGQEGYPELAKSKAMKQSAEAMGETFRYLDLNVNFEDRVNHVGVEQEKCSNCGDCVTGCNHKAKNTTAVNYLPDARNHGAEIYTEVAVKYIERSGEKWVVYFDPCNLGREKFDAPPLFIRAEKVFLGAGSLGSTEILMRSAAKGLEVSDMLGKRFTGNGDVLGFGYNNDQPIHGIGKGDKAKEDSRKPVGPCITSVIDMREKEILEEGMTMEEGSIPSPIRSIMKPALIPLSRLIGKNTDAGFRDYLKEKYRELVSFFRGPYHGAIAHTQTYLVMTHDDGAGTMKLDDDRLEIQWPGVGKQAIFQKVNDQLKKATKALGGNYIKSPSWTKLMDYDLVTVHPLGGCVMGDDAGKGVVDHKGQVFKGSEGTERHPGLYVMDGAIIPRSLGTNPLLTISAFAERNCKYIIEEEKGQLSYDFPEVKPKQTTSAKAGVQFTETMRGYFSTKEKEDYEKAADQGEKEDSPFEFTLTIRSEDVKRFVEDPEHEAAMIGTVLAPALSKKPLSTSQGIFNLFIDDPNDASRKKMLYKMQLHSPEGKSYYFSGFKDIHDDKGFDVWKDTTTLFITVHEGTDDTGDILGKGILKIAVSDLKKQMATMTALNTDSKKEKLEALGRFVKFFAGAVKEQYFS